jgi:hypothetical protein
MRGLLACLAVALLTIAPEATPAAARCPQGLLPLGRNAIPAAKAAAFRAAPAKEDPKVAGARLAVNDSPRGDHAKFECGAAVWRRTVVVYVTRRAYLPAQSASSGVYFVGRFHSGYRVWELVH